MGTSTSYAYDIGGNPYKMQDGDGMTISLATGSGTSACDSLVPEHAPFCAYRIRAVGFGRQQM
jgi:hypothetical protein